MTQRQSLYRTWGGLLLSALLVSAAFGCKKATPGVTAPSVPVVPVSHPVERMVTDYVEYTGRLDATQSVGVKARATGFLVSIGKDKDGKPIREGSEVQKGQLLFQIDPRPYQFQLDQAKSQVTVVERQLKLAQITLGRAKESLTKNVGSQQDVDQAEASAAEMQARLDAAKTSVETYQLNLDFTHVTAPIAGQISRFYFTPGNLIIQDQTLLTTLVDVVQVYAYFDMDERTLIKIKGQVIAGKIKPPVGHTEVLMALEGETGFPYSGSLDFINNVVNPSTGTISVRAIYENPKSPSGSRMFVPGMFVHIRLPIGQPHPGLLVVDRAISSDQGLKYVYVLGAGDKIQYRRVTTGPLEDDGLRVIEPYKPAVPGKTVESGLLPNELVVVGSLPQLRPDMVVSPDVVKMPTPGAPEEEAQAPGGGGAPAVTTETPPKSGPPAPARNKK